MVHGLLLGLGAVVATTVSAVLLYFIDQASGRSSFRQHWIGYLAVLVAGAIYASVGANREWTFEGGIFFVAPMCSLTVAYGIWCSRRSRIAIFIPSLAGLRHSRST